MGIAEPEPYAALLQIPLQCVWDAHLHKNAILLLNPRHRGPTTAVLWGSDSYVPRQRSAATGSSVIQPTSEAETCIINHRSTAKPFPDGGSVQGLRWETTWTYMGLVRAGHTLGPVGGNMRWSHASQLGGPPKRCRRGRVSAQPNLV
uniref:Uncharacterized protein n=1 Tax=Eutreptiella gymnastica TaxID=73025 RepID=A0A7S4D2D1_9EUGL